MREDQRDRLRVFVDDEGQQVLAVDALEKAERQGLDLLLDVVDRAGGVLAQGLRNQALGQIKPAGFEAGRVGIAGGEFLDRGALILGRDGADLGDLDRHFLNLGRVDTTQQVRRLVLRQAHQNHGGFADFRLAHGVICFF